MLESVQFPYTSSKDIEYLIKFTPFEPESVFEGVFVPIIDVTILLVSDIEQIDNDWDSLNSIFQIIKNQIDTVDGIYYSLCSGKPIKKSKRSEHMSNSEFRSALFTSIYERINISGEYIMQVFEVSVGHEDIRHLHLTTRTNNKDVLSEIAGKIPTLDKGL